MGAAMNKHDDPKWSSATCWLSWGLGVWTGSVIGFPLGAMVMFLILGHH